MKLEIKFFLRGHSKQTSNFPFNKRLKHASNGDVLILATLRYVKLQKCFHIQLDCVPSGCEQDCCQQMGFTPVQRVAFIPKGQIVQWRVYSFLIAILPRDYIEKFMVSYKVRTFVRTKGRGGHRRGPSNNYVDKMRGEGGQKMSVFVHAQSNYSNCPRRSINSKIMSFLFYS